MLLSDKEPARLPFRAIVLMRMLLLAGMLGLLTACSLTPVYSDRSAAATQANFTYPEPNSRLEQIVYNRLVQSFGRSQSPDARLVRVTVSSNSITPGTSVSLEARIEISDRDEKILFSGTRTASASYATTGQSLGNQQAANEASERAARELGETIRLLLLAFLSQDSR